jgi:hypothetical protein
MALLGAYGTIIFEASRRRINTFTDLRVNNEGRWAEHDVHLQLPILEFTGPGLTQVSFRMTFSSSWNNNPFGMLSTLRSYMRIGAVAPLLVGNKPVSLDFNLFALIGISEEHKYYDAKGNMFWASANVTLKEYRLLL